MFSHDIAEILLKLLLNTNQSINLSKICKNWRFCMKNIFMYKNTQYRLESNTPLTQAWVKYTLTHATARHRLESNTPWYRLESNTPWHRLESNTPWYRLESNTPWLMSGLHFKLFQTDDYRMWIYQRSNSETEICKEKYPKCVFSLLLKFQRQVICILKRTDAIEILYGTIFNNLNSKWK